MPVKSRTVDLALYAGIGILVVLVAVYYADHVPPSSRISTRWLGLAAITCVTFGYPVRWHRPLWPLPAFWLLLTACLIVHVAVYVYVLRAFQNWPMWLFAIVNLFETSLLLSLFENIELNRTHRTRAGH